MLDFNINVKLKEHNPDRDVLRPLSEEDALLGVERLAAAIMLQKKTTIVLPDRPIDADLRVISIDPKESLPDWSSDKIQPLLDRAIFDEAIYGTVRFHHRTVQEYLGAKWLHRLIKDGKSRRSIEGLLFANLYGRDVVIPPMRPIVAWLALWDDRVRNRLRSIAPEVLIENGDPSSLPIEFRKSLLVGFAELYAKRQYTGTSFDITMVRRLADPELSSTINNLLKKYAMHDDISTLLIKLIWQGQISESLNVALSYAMNDRVDSYIRTCAIRAVEAAGTPEQHRTLINTLLTDISKLSSDTIGELCELFFPDAISVPQLLEILKTTGAPEPFSYSRLQGTIERLPFATLPNNEAELLLRGLHDLLGSQPFNDRRHCEVSARYSWLLPSAIRVANVFIQKRHEFSFNPVVTRLFLSFFVAKDYEDFATVDRNDILKDAKLWPEFRYKIFWHAIDVARSRDRDSHKRITEWWQVRWDIRDFWTPGTDFLEQLFDDLTQRSLIDDRLIALSAVFLIYLAEERPLKLRDRMKQAVIGISELEIKLHELLHPTPLSEEEKKLNQQDRDLEQRRKVREKRQKQNREDWQKALKKIPEEIRDVGTAQKGEIWQRTVYLYDRIREIEDKTEHGLGYSNWKLLIDEFGFDVAKNFRDGCVAYWREYDPFTYQDRQTSNSIPWPRMIGLCGLAMESTDDPNWATKITDKEAAIAAHYSICELNGFPDWFEALHNNFPEIVSKTISDELRWELHESPEEKYSSRTLSALRYCYKDYKELYKTTLLDLLIEQEPVNDLVLDHALSLILEGQLDIALREKASELACDRFNIAQDKNRKFTWLIVLFCIDGTRGFELLKKWITGLLSIEEQKAIMIYFCAALTDHGNPRFSLAVRDYERIEVLRELTPFIYKFVKVEEDAQHKGAYTPDIRDHAERTRSHLLSVIYDTPGRSSYDALMNLCNTVGNSFLKDRMDYLAREHAALDAEFKPWHGSDVAEFTITAEKQPRSEADLYVLALARLDDLKTDIEDGDESEAVMLRKLTNESEVRVYFASRLQKSSRSLYTVGSEEELADASRTDIRLNTPQVSAPVPIELKIADKCTLTQLRERMENQLIGQYMRVSQYGIFLVVRNGEKNKKHWKDNLTHKMLTFEEVVESLKKHAVELTKKYPIIESIEAVGIDFTLR